MNRQKSQQSVWGLVLLCAMLFVPALVGCSQQQASSVKADNPQLVAVGASVGGKLDKGYPGELPLWEGAQVLESKHTDKGDFDIYELTVSVDEPYDTVVYGYGEGLKKCGYSAEIAESTNGLTMITATKKDVSALFTITKDETGKAEVSASIEM